MFNDLTNNQPAANPNLANSPAPAASSLPSQTPVAASAPMPKKEVDDIFSETDQVDTQGVFSQARPQIEARTVGLGAANFDADETHRAGGRAFKRAAVVFIILGVLGTGAYFVYSKLMAKSNSLNSVSELTPISPEVNSPEETTSIPPISTTTPVVSEFSSSSDANIISSTSVLVTPLASSTPVLSQIDSDNDGLLDSEEQTLGTNPNLIDTDNDGLSDYEEAKVYQTNPLVADTDGDSYSDGVEVRGGYNPNGSGKLIK